MADHLLVGHPSPCCRVAVSEGSSLIVGLFGWRGPSAVARLIDAVIVHAVDAVRFARAWAHILKERAKRIHPPSAHDNSSVEVILSARVRGLAAVAHIQPREVFSGLTHAVRRESFRRRLSLKAAATQMIATSQITRLSDRCVAAIASAEPSSFHRKFFSQANYDESSKAVSSEIDCSHGSNYNRVNLEVVSK